MGRTGTAAFTVGYATADGTAIAGSDYLAATGTLSFAAGQASQTISVTINGDTVVEPDETLFVNLANVTNGGVITRSQGVGTILNDDVAPVVGDISISDVSIIEGDRHQDGELHGGPYRHRRLHGRLRHRRRHATAGSTTWRGSARSVRRAIGAVVSLVRRAYAIGGFTRGQAFCDRAVVCFTAGQQNGDHGAP